MNLIQLALVILGENQGGYIWYQRGLCGFAVIVCCEADNEP